MHLNDNIISQLLKTAKEHAKSNQFAEALQVLDKALTIDPYHPLVHYEIGHLQRQLGQLHEALDAYTKVIALLPNDHLAHLAQSYVLHELQKHEEALAACERALQLSSNDHLSLLHKANLLMSLNQPQDALIFYEKILKDAPQHVDAILGKKHILHSMRNELLLKDQFDFIDNPTPQQVATSKTKFGGQPDWLEDPAWPISRTTGEPMQFIAQIEINPEQFPQAQGKVAYLFMAASMANKPAPAFWESDGGDNAVIIQPGGELVTLRDPLSRATKSPIFAKDYQAGTLEKYLSKKSAAPHHVEIRQLATGPTYCEEKTYISSLGVEPIANQLFDFGSSTLDQATLNECWTRTIASYRLMDTKIGGMPFFIQDNEYPAQLDCQYFFCQINLLDLDVDDGIFYVFLNETATKGSMLYQR